MLWCPICQKLEGFTTGSQMLKHFRALINDGVPVDLHLKCNLCQASYQSPKSFAQHITTYHEVPNPLDTQIIPNNCENCSSNKVPSVTPSGKGVFERLTKNKNKKKFP